jgi:hypothetical protein
MFSTIVSTADADLETKNKAYDELQELVSTCENSTSKCRESFKPLFCIIRNIHSQITNVQFANDEGDFGMGLELGLNAFLFGGKPLESAAKVLLVSDCLFNHFWKLITKFD